MVYGIHMGQSFSCIKCVFSGPARSSVYIPKGWSTKRQGPIHPSVWRKCSTGYRGEILLASRDLSNQEILVPDWLITSHVNLFRSEGSESTAELSMLATLLGSTAPPPPNALRIDLFGDSYCEMEDAKDAGAAPLKTENGCIKVDVKRGDRNTLLNIANGRICYLSWTPLRMIRHHEPSESGNTGP
eukprot:sb/3471382/